MIGALRAADMSRYLAVSPVLGPSEDPHIELQIRIRYSRFRQRSRCFVVWSRGRNRKETEPEPPTPSGRPETRLAVVEFWTAEQRLTVGMDLSQGRLTDLLNQNDSVRVAMLDMVPDDASQPIVGPETNWIELPVEQALLVFPPPQETDPQRRLHRPRQPIEISIGPFEVVASAHIPPGAQAAGFLLRQGSHFIPVTRAVVRDSQLGGFEQRANVVLVNLRMIATIRDSRLGEREAPDADATAPLA